MPGTKFLLSKSSHNWKLDHDVRLLGWNIMIFDA